MACECASGGSMASTNVIIADLSRTRTVRVKTLYQYNYGMKLKFTGIDDLPTSYEVHFANAIDGTSTTHIADETGVVIPRQYFIPGETIYAWLYLHPAEGSGVTDGMAVMPVFARAAIDESEPTEEERSAIEEAIEALNNAIDTTTEKATAAEAAKIASEAAQTAAEESAGSAAQNATAAEESATAAAKSATDANDYALAARRFGMATEELKNEAEQARDAALLNAQNASTSANEAAGYAVRAENAAIHEPRIVAGYWCVWSPTEQVYYNTGIPATGEAGVSIQDVRLNPDYTLTIILTNGAEFTTPRSIQGEKGDTGNGIGSIVKSATSGLIDTYTITYTDGETFSFPVANGNGVASIVKTGTEGLVDTYTITYTNGQTQTYTVANGAKGDPGEVTKSDFDQYVQEVDELRSAFALLNETLLDTVQAISFDQSGNVSQITHTRNGVVIRTDVFTFGTNTITEVRTLNTGESVTIVTDTSTLETTVTYAAA